MQNVCVYTMDFVSVHKQIDQKLNNYLEFEIFRISGISPTSFSCFLSANVSDVTGSFLSSWSHLKNFRVES